ncbi:GDP-mannose 4,6-dehydratase [Candidatus Woesebacteria bacterium RBG_13_34_9]|uniref:GDP-mannose 4,6-dehydratase n=1 Tax=Candidatus Woesebacteria bacterium RBG_13_34_9 TaxID=1802477 RepID=A0A1F7X6A1_9BACT|nr:MAG: GDP-mannose 4,6-dehydratase [Candidatus Woesebacteria bacterium RBG_13_34_9]
MSKIRNILITGITGFVGSHLAEYILKNHPRVKIYGLTRWRSPLDNINHISKNLNLKWGDLLDPFSLKEIIREIKPDVIFHLAAQSYVDFSFLAPVSTLETNVVGTANLLEIIKQLKIEEKYNPIVHICSSSEVYGQVNKDEIPIKENNPLRPASPYAVSKVAEDMLGYQYWFSWKIKTLRTRLFTHTGPRRGDVFVESNFAKQIAAIEAKKAKPIVYVGNLKSVRTFMDVRDAVRAYWLLVTKCIPGEVYNIGGKETMTVGNMLRKLILMSTRKDIKIVIDSKRLRPSDVTLQIPSTNKFQKATGWSVKIPFDKTLEDTLSYWRDFYQSKSG